MKNFIYDIGTKVYFGEGQVDNLGEELAKHGRKVLLCYGGGSIKKNGLYEKVTGEIKKAGLEVFELSGIDPNPRIDSVREGVKICKENDIDMVLAVGGGSTIDCAKFVACGACADYDPWEIISRRAKVEAALPIITVLTIAATGSEMDAGGVITNPETTQKLSGGSKFMQPTASFLDPTITYSVNAYQTGCGSADIFSHICEVYFSVDEGMYMLESVAEALMKTVIKYGPVAVNEPCNYEARANLMWASSWAINGFIEAGKEHMWSCHPMEHQLSAVYDITHGLGLAILTPRWMEYCLDETTLPRFVRYGINVWNLDSNMEPMEIAKKSIELTKEFLFGQLKLDDTFTKVGIKEEEFEPMAKRVCGGKTVGGFKLLSEKDVIEIYKMCL